MGDERTVTAGEPTVIESRPAEPPFWVAFEDDGDTGYLYALDQRRGEEDAIFDALHLYDAHESPGARRALRFVWAEDDLAVALLLDGRPEAVVDFAEPRLMCRSGFPAPGADAPVDSHAWDDDAYQRRFGV